MKIYKIRACKPALLLLLLCASIFLLTMSCSGDKEGSTQADKKLPPLVDISEVRVGAIARKATLPGTVRAEITANVLAPAEGTIASLSYREGDYVQKEAVLATLSPSIREDIITAARSKEGDEGALDFARRQFQEIAIVAPISGVIAFRNAETGDMVVQRQKLFEIQNASKLYVEVPVPEREITSMKVGMEAEVRLDAIPDRALAGKITRLYPRLDERTRTGTVEVSLPSSASEILKVGMFARVTFELEKADSAMLIPSDAITLSAKGSPVVFVVEDGKVSARNVIVGIESDGFAQILEGISPGEKAVRAGNEKLKDGAAVRLPVNKPENPREQSGEAGAE